MPPLLYGVNCSSSSHFSFLSFPLSLTSNNGYRVGYGVPINVRGLRALTEEGRQGQVYEGRQGQVYRFLIFSPGSFQGITNLPHSLPLWSVSPVVSSSPLRPASIKSFASIKKMNTLRTNFIGEELDSEIHKALCCRKSLFCLLRFWLQNIPWIAELRNVGCEHFGHFLPLAEAGLQWRTKGA